MGQKCGIAPARILICLCWILSRVLQLMFHDTMSGYTGSTRLFLEQGFVSSCQVRVMGLPERLATIAVTVVDG